MGPEREIDDPALQRMKLGPDVEPTEAELLALIWWIRGEAKEAAEAGKGDSD